MYALVFGLAWHMWLSVLKRHWDSYCSPRDVVVTPRMRYLMRRARLTAWNTDELMITYAIIFAHAVIAPIQFQLACALHDCFYQRCLLASLDASACAWDTFCCANALGEWCDAL